MLRFLARSKLAGRDQTVRLTTDRQEYRLGDPVRVQANFPDVRTAPLDDGGVTIALEQIGRETEKVQLRRDSHGGLSADRGHSRPSCRTFPPAAYHAKMIAPTLPSGVSRRRFRRRFAASGNDPRADGRCRDAASGRN